MYVTAKNTFDLKIRKRSIRLAPNNEKFIHNHQVFQSSCLTVFTSQLVITIMCNLKVFYHP